MESVDVDDYSRILFGRYYAVRVWVGIARLPKSEFTTGELVRISGVSQPDVSKELKRLMQIHLVAALSRRGDYRRREETPFWRVIDELAESWDSSADDQ